MIFTHTLYFLLFILSITIFTSAQSSASGKNDFAINSQKFTDSFQIKINNLEKISKGRLGVYAINTENNQFVAYRAYERFPFCSTGKVIIVAAVLKASMNNPKFLNKTVKYSKNDINKSGYAPITKHHVTQGMKIHELCNATLKYSDNTAANLLIDSLGGISSVNKFSQSIPDKTFQLNRFEPYLNSAIPGDEKDTSTPISMAQTLYKLAFQNILGIEQQQQLITWMKETRTGDDRIRAGVPKDWIVAEKTGSGDYGTTNDLGIIWPPNGKPIILAIYFTQKNQNAKLRSDVIASTTKILIDYFHEAQLQKFAD